MKKILIIWLILQLLTLLGAIIIRPTHTIVKMAPPVNQIKRDYVPEGSAIDELNLAEKFHRIFNAWITISQIINIFLAGIILVTLVLNAFIKKSNFLINKKYMLIYAITLFLLTSLLELTKCF